MSTENFNKEGGILIDKGIHDMFSFTDGKGMELSYDDVQGILYKLESKGKAVILPGINRIKDVVDKDPFNRLVGRDIIPDWVVMYNKTTSEIYVSSKNYETFLCDCEESFKLLMDMVVTHVIKPVHNSFQVGFDDESGIMAINMRSPDIAYNTWRPDFNLIP